MSSPHNYSLRDWFKEIMHFGQTKELMGPTELGLKLSEETGEFSEAVLWHQGWLQHKELSEPIEGEVADCLMLLLTTYATLFPETSPELLMQQLEEAFDRKFEKYKNVIIINTKAKTTSGD